MQEVQMVLKKISGSQNDLLARYRERLYSISGSFRWAVTWYKGASMTPHIRTLSCSGWYTLSIITVDFLLSRFIVPVNRNSCPKDLLTPQPFLLDPLKLQSCNLHHLHKTGRRRRKKYSCRSSCWSHQLQIHKSLGVHLFLRFFFCLWKGTEGAI